MSRYMTNNDVMKLLGKREVMDIIPAKEEIPKQFFESTNKWHKVISTWFYCGLSRSKWIPHEGINRNQALDLVSRVLKSYTPAHEHKIAACAYLSYQLFKEVQT